MAVEVTAPLALPPGVDPLQLVAGAARLKAEREGFYGFVQAFWRSCGERAPFMGNWHLEVVCLLLEAMATESSSSECGFELDSHVINVQPGSGKTMITSILWPAWVWACVDPGRRFIFTTFDHNLAHRTARKFMQLVQSPEYQAAYPKVRLCKQRPAEAEIENTAGGVRFAYQLGGGVLGRHANHIVCDDPIKPSEADMVTGEQLAKVVELWGGTFTTRALPGKSNFLVIMQRLSHDDLAGYCLRERGYGHLCYPARFVPDCPWDHGTPLGKVDIRTEPGELLWPTRFTEAALRRFEAELGSPQKISAQLQQNPVPASGSYFEDKWFRTWELPLPLEREMRFVQSWDLGFKGRAGKGSADSWVHGALWALHGKRIMLIAERHGHWNYPETKRVFVAAQQNPLWARAEVCLVEDKANGTALIAELGEMTGLMVPIRPVSPGVSKEERAKRHSARVEAGQIWLAPVEYMPSVGEFRAELVRFPHQKANDRVDTSTQAWDYFADQGAHYADVWVEIMRNA